ncbi:MAG: hypothetical protein COT74_07615 [Bdellovibrionales bacterium CG10_big_fil_rev_8_21_14_0_10_45_34]|nr:MAG: hypothetical protein COT74_07615 [Bdellovibrionales bacterium CG10_big_fil_rev_8_21_14_0_10_45_34]
MKFPFFDLSRQYPLIENDVEKRFSELLKSQRLVMGDAVTQFENHISDWTKIPHCISVASGTDALVVALKGVGVNPGDEVITPAYSFFASTGSIMFFGAKPVFADIRLEEYNIDPTDIERRITKKTKAIMVVHLYGQCADMDPILEIAKKHNIPVVEDFAQSLGATYKGRPAGAMGDAGATSFYPTKNLGGAGEGGMVTCVDNAVADRMKLIRVHGMRVRYTHEILGTNSRLDALQCAYLDAKLPFLTSWVSRRAQIANLYSRELAALSDKITLPKVLDGRTHVWNQYIVRVSDRDNVRKKLTEMGIPTEIYYPFTVVEQPVVQAEIRNIDSENEFPVSHEASRTSLALPIFPELTDDEVGMVIEGLKIVLND